MNTPGTVVALRQWVNWAWKVYCGAASEWQTDKVPRMAAAIAFYTLFSLTPMVLISVAVISLVFGREVALREVYHQAEMLIGKDGVSSIQLLVEHAPQHATGSWSAVLGIATIVFGATGAFVELKDSLNTIWEVRLKPGLALWEIVRERFLSFALVLVVGFFMVVSLMFSAALSTLGNHLLREEQGFAYLLAIANQAISLLLFGWLFAFLYRVLPDAEVRMRDVWLGAATTTLLFVIGKSLFGMYLGHSGVAAGFGAAGSLVIVILWTYYSALILLFGAEITQVQSSLTGERRQPSERAVFIGEDARIQQGLPHAHTIEVATAHTPPGPFEAEKS